MRSRYSRRLSCPAVTKHSGSLVSLNSHLLDESDRRRLEADVVSLMD